MAGIGDASPGIKRIGRGIGFAGKNGGFILGVLALTLGDLFLGQNFFQTMLSGVDNTPLFDSFWFEFITTRFLIALLISSCFSAVQMIGINMIVKGVRWKNLAEPGHKLGFILVWMFFLADAYFNFGGAAVLFDEVQEGTVLPVNTSQVVMAACFSTAMLGSFGTLLLYMFLDVGVSSSNGNNFKLLSFGKRSKSQDSSEVA